jgi:DNA-directed RNA polymerase subunit omega
MAIIAAFLLRRMSLIPHCQSLDEAFVKTFVEQLFLSKGFEGDKRYCYNRLQSYWATSSMQKRSAVDTIQIMRRAEELVNASSNRYRITVQVASRAKKRRRRENMEDFDEGAMKAVIQAILEMSDELTQPEIIGD